MVIEMPTVMPSTALLARMKYRSFKKNPEAPDTAYNRSAAHNNFSRPYRSINAPATGELKAINKAGRVSTSLTRNSESGISEKASDISGSEGEMVTMDIMVRLLTSRRVSFKVPVLLFIIKVFLSCSTY
jgi:hypothetical protein